MSILLYYPLAIFLLLFFAEKRGEWAEIWHGSFYDMAVRLNYSEALGDEIFICQDIKDALKEIVKTKDIKSTVVLPNYSAMLSFRKAVVGREIL